MLLRLIHEHEEKTVSPRARTILVQWDQFRPRFRKIAPKDAPALIAATRAAYLEAGPAEAEPVLARRSA